MAGGLETANRVKKPGLLLKYYKNISKDDMHLDLADLL